jgi:hypothetical protein
MPATKERKAKYTAMNAERRASMMRPIAAILTDPKYRTFTTGEVGVICDVAPRTVLKWFDSGKLKGYRIPCSKDRRIPREQLREFLIEQGFYTADQLTTISVALIGLPAQISRAFQSCGHDFQETTWAGFWPTNFAKPFTPVVVSASIGTALAHDLCDELAKLPKPPKVIVIHGDDAPFAHPKAITIPESVASRERIAAIFASEELHRDCDGGQPRS